MKWHWALVIFLLGAGSGWLAKGNATPQAPVTSTGADATKSTPTKTKRDTTTNGDAKWAKFGEKAAAFDYKQAEEFRKNLDPKDRGDALLALNQQTSPNGIEYPLRSLLENILKDWVKDDFEGAWAWANAQPSTTLRKYFMQETLSLLAETNPERAFELYKVAKAEDEKFQSSAPTRFLEASALQSTERFLNALNQLEFGNSYGGHGYKFAADFNFEQAMDGLVAAIKQHKGDHPSDIPTNLFESWAIQDPNAAHNWWSRNGQVGYESWGDILQAMEGAKGTSDTAEWAVEKLESAPPELLRKMLKEFGGNLNSNLSAARVEAIAQLLPTTEARDRFYGGLLVSTHDILSPNSKNHFLMEEISSPSARLEAIRTAAEQGQRIGVSDVSLEALTQWGITLDQINQAHEEGVQRREQKNR